MSEIKFRLLFMLGVFLIGALVMYFVYPLIHPESDVPLPVVLPDSTSQTAIPDTVWETKIQEIPIYIPEIVYRDTGRVDTVWKLQSPTVIGLKPPDPQYVSFKHFVHSDFAESKVWAFAPVEVDSFRIDNKVNWDKYYEVNVIPEFKMTLKQENKNHLMKGIAAGALSGAGIASQNVYLAGAGVLVGALIVTIW